MAATTPTPARAARGARDVEPVALTGGRWPAAHEALPDVTPTLSAVRAELAELRARLDRSP